MKTTLEKCFEAVQNTAFKKSLSLNERETILRNALIGAGVEPNKIINAGESPATGRVLGIKKMSDRVRSNYRCGYGKYN